MERTKRSDNAQWNRKFLEFSKWVSRNVLFHLILYWNFRKFWSNADHAQYLKGDMFSVAYMTYYLKNWPYRFVFTTNCNCSISVYAAFTKSLIKGFILERIFNTVGFTTSEVRYCLAIKCLCIPLKTEIPIFSHVNTSLPLQPSSSSTDKKDKLREGTVAIKFDAVSFAWKLCNNRWALEEKAN